MTTILDAVYLIDDDSLKCGRGMRTSWDLINEGGYEYIGDTPYYPVNSAVSGKVFLRRDTREFQGGTMTFEGMLENVSGDGLSVAFGTRTDAFFTLYTKETTLFAGNKALGTLSYGKHFLKIQLDMTKELCEVQLDGKTLGKAPFDKAVFPFNCLRIGYDEKATGKAGVYFVKLYVNYLFHDCCLNDVPGDLPDSYTVKSPRRSSVTNDVRVEGKTDCTYISRNRKGAKTLTKHSFDKSRGKVTLEIKYLMEHSDGKLTVSLLKDKKSVISVWDKGEELCLYSEKPLRKHHQNVWQTLRIQADTDTGVATVWLNGKKTVETGFEHKSKFVDAFSIVYEADTESSFMFSDIRVWVRPEEPEDYVPRPVVPMKKGDYVVGMNVCSLWREGTHVGWDVISPYDDLKPVLGYYDEGLPEVSDWEIKFLVEHGIDYELYCWYSSESQAPIKNTHLRHALLDGHFYAKYADMEKFALLWEACNCQHPTCLEDFKNNLVPYWLDYFFSDDRYMRIDNKAVMSCFGVDHVKKDLGGSENVREGLQYLREKVKELGYDDLIVMGCHVEPRFLEELGFDAFHAYHWGPDGYQLEVNKSSIQFNINQKKVHVVPTISTGFKNIGWGGERRPNLSVQDMYRGVSYCINEVLSEYPRGTWKAKMLHLSTWNEYGEGTYMMPSGLNGFGYLDAVRQALCVDIPHKDVVPTASQQARLSYLRVQERHMLRRTKYDVRPLPDQDTVVAEYTFSDQSDLDKWTFTKMSGLEIKDGKLYGRADEIRPEIELKEVDFDASQIAYVKMKFANADPNGSAPTSFFVNSTREENRTFREQLEISGWCTDREVAEYIIDLDTRWNWVDTIRGFKVIPTFAGSFVLESIAFCAGVKHKTMYKKNGKQMYFGDYLQEKQGMLYVPLDPESGIYEELGYSYEWFKSEGRLELWNKENKVTLVNGVAYAVKNGENYVLVRPVYLKDGIPTVSLHDLELLFDLKYEIVGDKMYLK